jgi:signal transduction histidine kinase
MQGAETGQRGYLLTNDEQYLAPYERARAQLLQERENLDRLTLSSPKVAQVLPRLRQLIDGKLAELAQTISLTEAGQREEALAIVRSDGGKQIMDEARVILATIIEDGNAAMARDNERLSRNAVAAVWATALGALGVLLVGAAAFWLVRRFTTAQVQARREIEELNLGLEARVSERTSALTRANEEMQRFAYIVSHDLRAPLVNIVGFAGELVTSVNTLQEFMGSVGEIAPPPPRFAEARVTVFEELPEAVDFIRASTTKMDKLINAILKMSREGRRELHPEQVRLTDLVERTFASVQHQLDAADAVVEIEPGLPVIYSDRLALEQVFGNLIDNALKYRAKDRTPRITVSSRRQGPEVIVTVGDNGRGIAAKDHQRVFELFRRAGKQDSAGEGIGLTHVRALVRRLGGDITVESALGEGSRFLIRLPLVFSPDNLMNSSS